MPRCSVLSTYPLWHSSWAMKLFSVTEAGSNMYHGKALIFYIIFPFMTRNCRMRLKGFWTKRYRLFWTPGVQLQSNPKHTMFLDLDPNSLHQTKQICLSCECFPGLALLCLVWIKQFRFHDIVNQEFITQCVVNISTSTMSFLPKKQVKFKQYLFSVLIFRLGHSIMLHTNKVIHHPCRFSTSYVWDTAFLS